MRQTKHGKLTGVHKDANSNWIMTVKLSDGTFKDYPHDNVEVAKTANTKRKKQ